MTLKAKATLTGGAPAVGTTVNFAVTPSSGNPPNAPFSIAANTDVNGVATIQYTRAGTGIDQIVANAGAVTSNTASASWVAGPARMVIVRGNPTRVPNGGGAGIDRITIDATLRNDGGANANNVTLTLITPLAPLSFVSPALPKVLGMVAPGSANAVTQQLNFNVPAGTPAGTIVKFSIKGTYTGGTFSAVQVFAMP